MQGTWILVASGSSRSEVEFLDNDEPDPHGVSKWLNGFDDGLIKEAKATSGLTLTVESDGTFAERAEGAPKVDWFDEEGVLQAQVTPFDGVIVTTADVSFLRPVEIASWALPVEGRYGTSVLRYDDGDTKISDGIRVIDGRLIRTVNVATDDLYLDRVVIVYERV
jgi:hypothetical protein